MMRYPKMHDFWREAVGEEIAEKTRVVALRGNVLTIEVASSPLLSELSGYRKAELLDALRSTLADAGRKQRIEKLSFKLGKFE